MADTTNLRLPLMASNQAQKHVTYNEAMTMLDVLTMLSVIDRDLTAPPGSPSDGDVYIPASGATGAWSGKDLNVTAYIDGVWRFYPPEEGWTAWIQDENALKVWNGSSWGDYNSVAGFLMTPAASVLTIASGVVTATQSTHKLAGQGGVADDLDTINGGVEGALLLLEQSNGSVNITLKHGTGNIKNFAAADVVLNAYGKGALYRYDGFNWIQYGV